MYLSLGEAAQKQFEYKNDKTTLWDLNPAELLRLTNEGCQVKKTVH